jgi:hypothetical protein
MNKKEHPLILANVRGCFLFAYENYKLEVIDSIRILSPNHPEYR